MKTTITIRDGLVQLSMSAETDIERMTIRELGDDIGVSRSHDGIVLRQRAKAQNIRKINAHLAEADTTPIHATSN